LHGAAGTEAPTESPTYSSCFYRDLQRNVKNGDVCNGVDQQCGLRCGKQYVLDSSSGIVPTANSSQNLEFCISTCENVPECYSTSYINGADGGCTFYNEDCWLYHHGCSTKDVENCQSSCNGDQYDCDIGVPNERVFYWRPEICSKDPAKAPTTETPSISAEVMTCHEDANFCNRASDHADIEPNTYHLFLEFSDTKSWDDAAAACASRGMILAAVTESKQFIAVREMIKRGKHPGSNYWMGGERNSSSGAWSWPWGDSFYPGPCANFMYGSTQGQIPWKSGEPNGVGRRCLIYAGANRKWQDSICTSEQRYVCQTCESCIPILLGGAGGPPDDFQTPPPPACNDVPGNTTSAPAVSTRTPTSSLTDAPTPPRSTTSANGESTSPPTFSPLPPDPSKSDVNAQLALALRDVCTNSIIDGFETDIDCGGSVCALCDMNKRCKKNSDCATMFCTNATCTNSSGVIDSEILKTIAASTSVLALGVVATVASASAAAGTTATATATIGSGAAGTSGGSSAALLVSIQGINLLSQVASVQDNSPSVVEFSEPFRWSNLRFTPDEIFCAFPPSYAFYSFVALLVFMLIFFMTYHSLLGYILLTAFTAGAIITGIIEFSYDNMFACVPILSSQNVTMTRRRLAASVLGDGTDPWVGVGDDLNVSDFESMVIDAQGDPSAFFVGNLGLVFVAILACTFAHYVMYGFAHPKKKRQAESIHHYILKKLVSKHSFPRWELTLLILLYNGLSESSARALVLADDPFIRAAAGFLIFTLLVISAWSVYIVKHYVVNKGAAKYDPDTKAWSDAVEYDGFCDKYAPLFATWRGDMNRALFFALVAQPFQIARALTIGLLYYHATAQIVLLSANLILEMIIVVAWRPSIDVLDDFLHVASNFGVTVICILSFWRDPASQTIMFLAALGLVVLNGGVIIHQNSTQIAAAVRRVTSPAAVRPVESEVVFA